ncbi:hypothetical protein F8M41_006306 [Gigaspora margarita]|uniref:Uncharacterized protein n=1 Tax=Gigaspora margarita TaxID=4874 RepID=A0A8H3X811_GIGMA|nr:hypothetical protein F8M41_006306 [Gigaspora margarita]
MYIKETYGCHASGYGCENRSNYKCGAKVTYANLQPNSILNLTVQSPDYRNRRGTAAIGHFSMQVDNEGGHYFFKKPTLVNGCNCDSCDNIPLSYNSQWPFDLPTPQKGTGFDIWISIYWNCLVGEISVPCNSEDVHYRGYVS